MNLAAGAEATLADRLATLRDSWDERRQVAAVSNGAGFDAHFALLETIHGWLLDATAAVERVYGAAAGAALSPLPCPTDDPPGVVFSLATGYRATFRLERHGSSDRPRWTIEATLTTPGAAGDLSSPAGPGRRAGVWSRRRVEDVVLALAGAMERARVTR